MASTSGSQRTVVKVSRDLIPTKWTYDEFTAVFRQLLVWARTLQGDLGPASDQASSLLNDYAQLQKYLYFSNGNICEAQDRVIAAVGLEGHTSTLPNLETEAAGMQADEPSADSMNGKLNLHAAASIAESSPEPVGGDPAETMRVKPSALGRPYSNETARVPAQDKYNADSPKSQGLRPDVSDAASSCNSDSDEEVGAATLLMLRRRKGSDLASLPSPLRPIHLPSSDARFKSPTAVLPTSAASTRLFIPPPPPPLPSSHPYYRSQHVLASPFPRQGATYVPPRSASSSIQASRSTIARKVQSPGVPVSSQSIHSRIRVHIPPPNQSIASAGSLPAGLGNLHLSSATSSSFSASAQTVSRNRDGLPYRPTPRATSPQSPPHPQARRTYCGPSSEWQSPRIYIPPPRYSPTIRRLSHRRASSDGAASSRSPRPSPGGLRFIHPQLQTGSDVSIRAECDRFERVPGHARGVLSWDAYHSRSHAVDSGRDSSKDRPRLSEDNPEGYDRLRSPHKESFLRTPTLDIKPKISMDPGTLEPDQTVAGDTIPTSLTLNAVHARKNSEDQLGRPRTPSKPLVSPVQAPTNRKRARQESIGDPSEEEGAPVCEDAAVIPASAGVGGAAVDSQVRKAPAKARDDQSGVSASRILGMLLEEVRSTKRSRTESQPAVEDPTLKSDDAGSDHAAARALEDVAAALVQAAKQLRTGS